MLGRLLAAIEDAGGGYQAEALRKYASIVRDIRKKQYQPCLVWLAYDGYGETLTVAKKKDKAIDMLNQAVEVAKNLSDKERTQSRQHLEAALQLK
jgi:lipoate synthase